MTTVRAQSPEYLAWLRGLIEADGRSVNAAASMAGVDQSLLGKVLRGKLSATDAMLRKLATAIGADPALLIARAAADRLGAEGVAYVVADSGLIASETPGAPRSGMVSSNQAGANQGSTMVSGNRTPDTEVFGRGNEGMPKWHGNRASHWVPLYGPVAAGEPLMWTTDEAQAVIQGEPGDDAAFRIRGNSVSRYGVWDGDIVYARRPGAAPPKTGDMVVIEHEGAYCCKIYRETVLGRHVESHEDGRAAVPFKLIGEVNLVAIVTDYRVKHRPLL